MKSNSKSNWVGLSGICIAGFLGCLDLTIVNTALPAIQADFNSSVTQLQWVMNILLLALTAFMVISGKIADLYGRRLCLYLGLILFAISSIGAGLSLQIHWLIGFRFLQGISIAFLYTAPIALIPSIFPLEQQGRTTGILIGANGLGLAIGPIVGGFIVSLLNWRWIFFINPPLVVLSLLLCWKTLNESKSAVENKKIDWWGFSLLIIALPAGILALVEGEIWGWLSVPTLSLFILSIISLLCFYWVETKVKNPIVDFHLLTNRIFLIGLAANFSLALFYAIDFFLIPLYLHYIHGQSGYQIGLSLLPATVMVALLSSVTGRIVDKRGPKEILMLGLALFFVSAILQSQFNASTPLYFILFAYLIFGIGWACILSPSFVAALSSVPNETHGVAMGTIGTLHNLGGAIGLAFGTLIYTILSKSSLRSQAIQQQLPLGSWIDKAINSTDHALEIIQKSTPLNTNEINQLFQHYFLSGYKGAMWLLVITSIIAFFTVTFGLKKIKI